MTASGPYWEDDGERSRHGTQPLVLEGDALEDALAEIASLQTPQQKTEYYQHSALRGHRRISALTACTLWETLLVPAFPCAKAFVEFVRRKRCSQSEKGTVSLDEWLMFREFAATIDESFSNHNANEAWPSIIDEFVECQRVRSTYVGLRNQGATCYLNSLLQTLFIIPEFRKALFAWRPSSASVASADDSIPLQLQRLFGAMQVLRGGCLSTTALTTAFGWGAAESFRQHDVLELLQVLVDALDAGQQSTGLTELLTGTTNDYVRCLACGTERSHVAPFINISLDIVGVDTLRAALERYVQPEILDGPNAVHCVHCNQLTRSTKGMRIVSLPDLLFIHLGRFAYDRTFQQRVKINTVLRFPFLFDSTWLGVQCQQQQRTISEEDKKKLIAAFEAKSNALEIEITKHLQLAEDNQQRLPEIAAFHRMVVGVLQADHELLLSAGSRPFQAPLLFELFAVLVHSGSAQGGHYYSIAKSFERNGKWFNFNDSHVTEVNCGNVCKTFGTSAEQSSTIGANAYMLVYRKVTAQNVCTIDDSCIPTYIREADAANSLGFVENMAAAAADSDFACDDDTGAFWVGDDDDDDDDFTTVDETPTPSSTTTKQTKPRQASGVVEVNLFMMPALETPRETLTVAHTDSFGSFFAMAIAAISNRDAETKHSRMRLYDPQTLKVGSAIFYGTDIGTMKDVLKEPLFSVNMLVEFAASQQDFPLPKDFVIRVSLVTERDAPPISRRFLWLPAAATVADLRTLLSRSWETTWNLPSRSMPVDRITVLQLGEIIQPALTLSLRNSTDCTIHAVGALVNTRQSEPSLKIQKQRH